MLIKPLIDRARLTAVALGRHRLALLAIAVMGAQDLLPRLPHGLALAGGSIAAAMSLIAKGLRAPSAVDAEAELYAELTAPAPAIRASAPTAAVTTPIVAPPAATKRRRAPRPTKTRVKKAEPKKRKRL